MSDEINIPELIELARLDETEEDFLQRLSNKQPGDIQRTRKKLEKQINKFIRLGKARIEELTLDFKKRIERLKEEDDKILFFEKWSLSLCLEALKK